ncbi:MAG: contact-dependent growth inhibition system immunity protein [Planctomycetota bacterium]|nr:contact-dependent growth inhibition system immunity protein [Planctomycetota bacterium]
MRARGGPLVCLLELNLNARAPVTLAVLLLSNANARRTREPSLARARARLAPHFHVPSALQKPIEDFTSEDLRIMIGRNIGLQFLMPTVVTALEDNPLAEGDFYLGDLLKNVTSIDIPYLDR